jgi:hypothetical protein
MKDEYYAHSPSGTPKEDWHRLEDHLKAVAEMAQKFANDFNAGDWGYLAGLSCDKENSIIGKGYSYGQETCI